MKKLAFLITIIVLNFPIFSQIGNDFYEQKFKEANQLYSQNKFEEAAEKYQEIIEAGYVSKDLFYNAGNTFYRLNKIGESICFYEKALLSDPNNEDIKYNLELANLRVKNRPAILPENAIVSFFQNLIFLLSLVFWAYISIFLFVVFLIMFFMYIKSQTTKLKKIYFLISAIVLFFSLTGMFFMQYQTNYINSHNLAIVIEDEVQAKSSPDEKANTIFSVFEGFKVKIENKAGDWCEIKLTDGKKAWIKYKYLKTI